LWGYLIQRTSPVGSADFKAIYYGARCLIQHGDPYKESDFLRVYQADEGNFPADSELDRLFRRAVPICINLPSALFLIAPFTLLGWGAAHLLWMLLVATSLFLAGYLIWSLAAKDAPALSLFLVCILLANCETFFSNGNLAGIAVPLCMIAVCCFVQEKFVAAGVFCLAVSLALKPHDVLLVWLFFLLAGGVYRKRALQTLLVTSVLLLPAMLWVTKDAPQWRTELRSNVAATSAHGDLGDPGPASLSFRKGDMIIDLQSVLSIFRDNLRFYNPASYLICGALLLAWLARTLRAQHVQPQAWFALAAIAALSMLPVYHRLHDAKLLLLTVPACAILWAEGSRIKWVALVVTTAGIVLTADIPSTILVIIGNSLHLQTAGVCGKILTVVLMRPAPLILFIMAVFYLWVYLRRNSDCALSVSPLKMD
jgi:hypothetical protein